MMEKTLEEVIAAWEFCSKNRDTCQGCPYQYSTISTEKCYEDDAFYYLKEIKEQGWKRAYTILMKDKKCESEAEESNSSLTWDELKQMDGKPVWVEVNGKWSGKFWAFIELVNDKYFNFYQKGQEYPEDLWKYDFGKTWQVYRKERNETG